MRPEFLASCVPTNASPPHTEGAATAHKAALYVPPLAEVESARDQLLPSVAWT